MRIKIEKVSFLDFIKIKINTDKINISASFLIIYAYVMLRTRYNMMMSTIERMGAGLGIGLAGTVLIYGLLYFFKYRKQKGENTIIKARFDKDSVKEFMIFGSKKEYKMQAYTQFNKMYETKSAFFLRFDGLKYLFIPKKYLKEEEKEFISKKINNR